MADAPLRDSCGWTVVVRHSSWAVVGHEEQVTKTVVGTASHRQVGCGEFPTICSAWTVADSNNDSSERQSSTVRAW